MRNPNLAPQLSAARESLLHVLGMVDEARATQGRFGGRINLRAAEMAAGRFTSEHGKTVLDHILKVQGIVPQAVSRAA